MKQAVLVLLAFAVASTGCAAPLLRVSVRSNAERIMIYEGNTLVGSGAPPVEIRLAGDVDHDLTVKAIGREPKPLHLESHLSGGKLTLGILGALVLPFYVLFFPFALASGAYRSLEPDEPVVDLPAAPQSVESK